MNVDICSQRTKKFFQTREIDHLDFFGWHFFHLLFFFFQELVDPGSPVQASKAASHLVPSRVLPRPSNSTPANSPAPTACRQTWAVAPITYNHNHAELRMDKTALHGPLCLYGQDSDNRDREHGLQERGVRHRAYSGWVVGVWPSGVGGGAGGCMADDQ